MSLECAAENEYFPWTFTKWKILKHFEGNLVHLDWDWVCSINQRKMAGETIHQIVCVNAYAGCALIWPQCVGTQPSRGAWTVSSLKKDQSALVTQRVSSQLLKENHLLCGSRSLPLSLAIALQSIAGQEQENKCALCTCVCLSAIPPARHYISECSFGSTAKETKQERKKLPKVQRRDLTYLERHRK